MAIENVPESTPTFRGGVKGMVIGAVTGALIFGILTIILDLFRVGNGGPGLGVMAGIVVGGLAGTVIGAIKSSRRELHAR